MTALWGNGRRCADFLLLNKTDLLKEGQLEELRGIVATLNPFAAVRGPHPLPAFLPSHSSWCLRESQGSCDQLLFNSKPSKGASF